MHAVLSNFEFDVRLVSLTEAWLETVLCIEQQVYSHPWTRGNFVDACKAGYAVQLLMQGDEVLGYFVAMQGVDEVHLLNITVAPKHQGLGWGQQMLTVLSTWARDLNAQWLWLEVRISNTRALQLYERIGYRRVGLRKQYYPLATGQREDAIVMSLKL